MLNKRSASLGRSRCNFTRTAPHRGEHAQSARHNKVQAVGNSKRLGLRFKRNSLQFASRADPSRECICFSNVKEGQSLDTSVAAEFGGSRNIEIIRKAAIKVSGLLRDSCSVIQ
jgi:hypothetical protein